MLGEDPISVVDQAAIRSSISHDFPQLLKGPIGIKVYPTVRYARASIMAIAYLLCGPSLAGKSTAAKQLARVTGAVVLSADDVNSERGLPFGAEGLPESVWAETLRTLLDRLHANARLGASVVIDDTQCYRWLRDRYRSECIAAGLQPVLLLISPPQHLLYERRAHAEAKNDRAVLSLKRMTDHLARFEWPDPDEAATDLSSSAVLGAYLFLIQQATPLGDLTPPSSKPE
jgi:predicted kinase